jgi:hypothetical protein
VAALCGARAGESATAVGRTECSRSVPPHTGVRHPRDDRDSGHPLLHDTVQVQVKEDGFPATRHTSTVVLYKRNTTTKRASKAHTTHKQKPCTTRGAEVEKDKVGRSRAGVPAGGCPATRGEAWTPIGHQGPEPTRGLSERPTASSGGGTAEAWRPRGQCPPAAPKRM